jgi:hypothetical protein
VCCPASILVTITNTDNALMAKTTDAHEGNLECNRKAIEADLRECWSQKSLYIFFDQAFIF